MIYYFIAVLAAAYLLGSINFGIITSKLFHKDDIRTAGSGNPGATNAYRTYGVKAALVVLAGDMLKGVVAALAAKFAVKYFGVFEYTVYLASVCAVLGHMFPVFFKFKGGKGVATAAGAALIAEPLVLPVLLILFVIIVLSTKYVSLGSLTVAMLYPVSVFVLGYFVSAPIRTLLFRATAAAVIGLLIIIKHRGNIVKLIKGTENKINFKK